MEPAAVADAVQLLALRDAAATWIVQRGLRQWVPGEVSLTEVDEQVGAGEWHVVRDGSRVVGGLRLLWDDEPVWGPQPADAAYVHGLVIDRRYAGTGLGRSMLDWASGRTHESGRPWLRLDCAEANPSIRDYYLQLGFEVVGRRELEPPWHPIVLLQRAASSPSLRATITA